MENWVTAIVALIVALSTLGAAFLHNWFSHKRFKVELGRAIDVENRKRRWEVRSEPLIKLREELATVTVKIQHMVIFLNEVTKRIVNDQNSSSTSKILDDCTNTILDLTDYYQKGYFQKTVFMLDEKEIVDKVTELEKKFHGMNVITLIQIKKSIEQTGFPPQKLDQPLNDMITI